MAKQSKDDYMKRNLKIYRRPVSKHKMTFTAGFKYGEVYRDENLCYVLICLPCYEYCKNRKNCIRYDNFEDFRVHLEMCHLGDGPDAYKSNEQDELETLMAGIGKDKDTAGAQTSLEIITATLKGQAQTGSVPEMDTTQMEGLLCDDSSAGAAVYANTTMQNAVSADEQPLAARNDVASEIKCKICEQTYREWAQLDQHLREHVQQRKRRRPFQCSYCGKRMNTEEVLLRHYWHFHEITPIDQAKTNSNSSCSSSSSSSSRPTVRGPAASGHARETVRCRVCQHGIRRVNMQKHLNMHDDKRPFECDYCGRSYRQKQTLRMHIKKFHEAEFHADAPVIHLSNNQLMFHSQAET